MARRPFQLFEKSFAETVSGKDRANPVRMAITNQVPGQPIQRETAEDPKVGFSGLPHSRRVDDHPG
jgi:hypothetical protein